MYTHAMQAYVSVKISFVFFCAPKQFVLESYRRIVTFLISHELCNKVEIAWDVYGVVDARPLWVSAVY